MRRVPDPAEPTPAAAGREAPACLALVSHPPDLLGAIARALAADRAAGARVARVPAEGTDPPALVVLPARGGSPDGIAAAAGAAWDDAARAHAGRAGWPAPDDFAVLSLGTGLDRLRRLAADARGRRVAALVATRFEGQRVVGDEMRLLAATPPERAEIVAWLLGSAVAGGP